MIAPWKYVSFSDVAKLEWEDLDQTIARLKYLDITPAGVSDFSAGWTEVDSGSNVNIEDGVAGMNGSGTAAQNGLFHTAGIARAQGFFEYEISVEGAVAIGGVGLITGSAALTNTRAAGTTGLEMRVFFQPVRASLVYATSTVAFSYNTYYKVRLYVLKSPDNIKWGRFRCTLQGGTEYVAETIVVDAHYFDSGSEFPETMYLTLQRVSTDSDITYFKNVKMFFGFATDSPYTRYCIDGGALKINGFNFADFAMPGSLESTNLTFKYAFSDDAIPTMSSELTLAQLKAVGALTGKYRYVWLDVIANSDGAKQALSAAPNAINAIDEVSNPLLVLSLADEANRNTDMLTAFVLSPASGGPDPNYKTRGVERVGTAESGDLDSPTAPTLSGWVISSTSIALRWIGGTNINYVKVYYKTPETEYAQYGSDNTTGTITLTGLTADTAYIFKVTAYNQSGSNVDSDEIIISTLETAEIPADNQVTDLLDQIRTSILEIDGFKSSNVVVGFIDDIESREDSSFPLCEIVPGQDMGRGSIEQRTLEKDLSFQLFVHYRTATIAREDGTDIKTISRYGSAILRQLYRFNDLSTNGNPPCEGFLQTNAEHSKTPYYQQVTDNINTDVIEISFRVEVEDTKV
jgi:hypothetical protein